MTQAPANPSRRSLLCQSLALDATAMAVSSAGERPEAAPPLQKV